MQRHYFLWTKRDNSMKKQNKYRTGFFSEEAQSERIRLLHKFSPKLQLWNFAKSERLGGYIFKFIYKTDKYYTAFELPILEPLPEIQFNPEIDGSNRKSIINKLYKFFNKPLVFGCTLFSAFAVIGKIAFDLNKFKIGLASYNLAAMYASIAVLGISVSFVLGAIFVYAILPILRDRLKAKFDHIEHDLKCELPWSPGVENEKYAIKLPLIYSIILNKYFPGNRDLKWRFYYLDTCCKYNWIECPTPVQHSLYNRALEYCDNADQRFLCLRPKINSAHSLCVVDEIEELYDDHVKSCVSQISSESKLHNELGESLRAKLIDCLNTLTDHRQLDAIQKFNAIDFDAYSRKAYPGTAILYYQLDAVLTLLGRDNPLQKVHRLCEGARFGIVKHCFCMVRENIDKFYTTYSSAMYHYAFEFSEFLLELPNQNKSKPGKPLLSMANSNKHFKILSIESEPDENNKNRPVCGL